MTFDYAGLFLRMHRQDKEMAAHELICRECRIAREQADLQAAWDELQAVPSYCEQQAAAFTSAYYPGEPVWWLYTPRGGYGYTERVIAVVIKPARSRIGIAVLKADRVTWVPKWVRGENIKPREDSVS